MPTPLEIAKEREARKLARAGLNPDGTVIGSTPRGNDEGGDEGDDDGDPRGADFRDDGDDEGGGGGDPSAEIADLRRQLAALQGRVAPSQRDADEFRRLWQTEVQARATERQELTDRLAALEGQLQTRQQEVTLETLLTEEERRDIDPVVLVAMQKIATAAAKSNAPKVDARADVLAVLEQREKDKVQNYRIQVLNDPTKGLHHLAQLAYDPAFQKWSQEGDNDVDSVVSSLMAATRTEEVDRYARIVSKRIAAFRARKDPPTDTRTALGTHMRRGEKTRMTTAEINAKVAEAKALARSHSPKDRARAKEILDSLPS